MSPRVLERVLSERAAQLDGGSGDVLGNDGQARVDRRHAERAFWRDVDPGRAGPAITETDVRPRFQVREPRTIGGPYGAFEGPEGQQPINLDSKWRVRAVRVDK